MRRWRPSSGQVKGIVNLMHGMAEHSGRYAWFAEGLTSRGFELWAADQRGHGKTADPAQNDPALGGLLGHASDRDGFFRVVKDVFALNAFIRETWKKEGPGKDAPPLFVMGHSWGSFIVQAFMESIGPSAKEAGIAGTVLSGTDGPGSVKIALAAPLMACIAAFKGARRVSKTAVSLSFSSYNALFKPNRTAFDWLSRDEKAVDAYIADPFCGMDCSSGFFRDLTAAFGALHKKEAMEKIPLDLPVYVFSGGDDPVGAMGKGPAKLADIYRERGMRDVELKLYPGARHEALNETNREEVREGVLDWLLRHC